MKSLLRKTLVLLPTKLHLRLMSLYFLHYNISFKNPKTFNEKIQWLKIYDFKPHYKNFVDKYKVRDYISEILGDELLIPLYGVYNRPEEISWDELPNSFVIKWNHGPGSNIIIKDKTKVEFRNVVNELKKMKKRNWYWYGREKPYCKIDRKLIIEKFLDNNGKDLYDYKIHCFSGKPRLVQVDIDRFSNHKRNLYDTDWRLLKGIIRYENADFPITKPNELDYMLDVAEKLSKDFKYIRIDLYNVNGKVYFGEMTFYHGSGFEVLMDKDFDYEMGSLIKI